MKLQAPSTKLQRSSKSQAPRRRKNNASSKYSNNGLVAARLFEVANGNGNGKERHPFDLEERTAVFGEAIISVGANYCEANERVSKKDFRNTIGRCVKEAKETKYFLRLIATAEPRLADEARALYREAKELHLIFATMYRQ